MRFANLTVFTVLALSIFLVSCSPNNSTVLPAPVSDTSSPVAKPASRDAAQVEWEKTITEAKKEGKVVAYGAYGLSLARDPMIKAFNEKYGIALEMTIAQGPQLTTKLLSERGAGLYIADVYMGGGGSILFDLIPRNILDPIEPYLALPEIKDPSVWFGGSLPYWEKHKVSLTTLANVPAGKTAINTRILKPEEITSYKDLLNPKLKGVIIMADPSISGGGASWFHLAYRLMGEDYLKELVKQEPVITRDFRLEIEWIVRGKSAVAIGPDTGSIIAANKDGAPVALLPVFKEGEDIGLGGGIVGAINKSPRPNATKVFINWILSREGATILSKATGMASRRLDVPTDHLLPWMVPNPNMKYLIQDEDYTIEENGTKDLAKEIFAPLLK